jgi:ribonuclease P protein component
MKLGRKAVTDHMVVYLNKTNESHPFMFGLVVGKTVGNAVERNLVKRRVRAAIQTRMQNFQPGEMLVVRALPGLGKISWDDLCEELDHNITRVKN